MESTVIKGFLLPWEIISLNKIYYERYGRILFVCFAAVST